MFKRFQVLDLFDHHEEKDSVQWIDVSKELPDKKSGVFWVKLSDGDEIRAYYCEDMCERMVVYYECSPSHWWDKKEKTPLYTVTHWGKHGLD